MNGFPRTNELLHRKASSWNRSERFGMESRRSIFVAENNGSDKKRDVNIRRISVLPVHIELEDDGNFTDQHQLCITRVLISSI